MTKINHQAMNFGLRDRSGAVNALNPLVSVFYDLLKLGTPAPQDLELLVRDACACAESKTTVEYTNGYLAKYAFDMVRRLAEAGDEALELAIERAYQTFERERGRNIPQEREAFKIEVRKLLKGQY